MAPTDNSDTQFRFLISCIKNSVAGKVDFQAVADELEIVSKAAAAKRYERLLKAHDASPRKAPADGPAEGTPAKKPAPRKRGAAKISKAEPVDDDDEDEDIKDEYKTGSGSEYELKSKKKSKRIGSDRLVGESALGAEGDDSTI